MWKLWTINIPDSNESCRTEADYWVTYVDSENQGLRRPHKPSLPFAHKSQRGGSLSSGQVVQARYRPLVEKQLEKLDSGRVQGNTSDTPPRLKKVSHERLDFLGCLDVLMAHRYTRESSPADTICLPLEVKEADSWQPDLGRPHELIACVKKEILTKFLRLCT
ncbi:dehydrogenase/reductase SDR family member 7C [Striga asiatica]|uniref:Dehydrogenase/reductase SDR family member 7C n=1 Tax=Striga asiatica TaxID=4170 RepID=A0A5A7P9V5_STRAF|nr:dehydrogenase/reductase SDR family member 7C [Striga asiatica]